MQQYFGVSNRVAAGLVLLFKEKMGVQGYVLLQDNRTAYENPLVTLILKEVFKMTQEPVKDREGVFAPDGTRLHRSMKLTGKTIRGRSAHPEDTIR
ncbi:MAG: hypothetical protein B6U86_00460 [Candidatus Altiarchaeales archaeon ex4484_43]|nr:MAG: hypothetical protein B6U86_00460 [Candidatus Altiarchaeales archaeon ex4484_43]